MKVNKHRRLGKIIQTLERWAPLEVSEISQNLAISFGVEESDIKRNVNNDLKFLRDEGEVTALYFNKFGKLVSREIEPEDESFYRIKWQLREQGVTNISGAHELNRYSGHIQATPELEQKLKIRKGLGKNAEDWNYFYFDLNNELHHLAIPKQPLGSSQKVSLALGLCRTKSTYPKEYGRDFIFFSANYLTIPHVLISFKDPFISSMDSEAPIAVEFLENGRFNIKDNSNKNPLQFLEVPQGKAKNLLTYLSLFRDQTQTTHWTDLKREEGLVYKGGSGIHLNGPILLRLKETTGYLIH